MVICAHGVYKTRSCGVHFRDCLLPNNQGILSLTRTLVRCSSRIVSLRRRIPPFKSPHLAFSLNLYQHLSPLHCPSRRPTKSISPRQLSQHVSLRVHCIKVYMALRGGFPSISTVTEFLLLLCYAFAHDTKKWKPAVLRWLIAFLFGLLLLIAHALVLHHILGGEEKMAQLPKPVSLASLRLPTQHSHSSNRRATPTPTPSTAHASSLLSYYCQKPSHLPRTPGLPSKGKKAPPTNPPPPPPSPPPSTTTNIKRFCRFQKLKYCTGDGCVYDC